MTWFFIIKIVLLLLMLGLALYQDIRERKIKNWLTLPAALAGIALNIREEGQAGLIFSLQGWLIPILGLFVFYIINVMGAGDIKLFAAIGSLMGFRFTALSFVFSIFAGGVAAFVILFRERAMADRIGKMVRYFYFMALTRKLLPYVARGDTGSKFIFTLAIVPGTIIQLLVTLVQQKG